MRYLLILSISLLLLSCEGNNIGPSPSSCDIKVSQNNKKWDVLYCTYSTRSTERWRFKVEADRAMHRKYQYFEELTISNIPYEAGKYALEQGKLVLPDPSLPSQIRLMEIQGDRGRNVRTLSSNSDNYIRIDSFDPVSGKIEGSFYSEWKKTDSDSPGPEKQIVKSDYFEIYLNEGD